MDLQWNTAGHYIFDIDGCTYTGDQITGTVVVKGKDCSGNCSEFEGVVSCGLL